MKIALRTCYVAANTNRRVFEMVQGNRPADPRARVQPRAIVHSARIANMCGIAGVFAYDARTARADRGAVERVCQHMSCRGPDDEGLCHDADGRVVLGHWRLAIIDLTARAAQPMHRADERYVIVFNDEIYNHRALRSALEAKGRRLASDFDTEVLPHVSRAKTGFAAPVQGWVATPEVFRTERGLRGWAKRVYSEHLAQA